MGKQRISDEEWAMREVHLEEQCLMDGAKACLAKLNVAELRVLMAHYCGGSPREYDDISKRDLIAELAPEYAFDERR